jgi:hypothetical protein
VNHPYRFFFRRLVLWLRRSFSFLWLALVAGYLMVLAGHAVYDNYQSQQETLALQQELVGRQQEEERLQALLVYYKTDTFKEQQLRQDLLLKLPQEKVYALPESSGTGAQLDIDTIESDSSAAEAVKKPASSQPIWQQWLHYFWTGDR